MADQNYKMDAVSAAHINAERERQLVAFDFMVGQKKRSSAEFRVKRRARLGASAMHPQGFPYRDHPKAVVKQVKRVCDAYPDGLKLRTVTDAGAVRQPRRVGVGSAHAPGPKGEPFAAPWCLL